MHILIVVLDLSVSCVGLSVWSFCLSICLFIWSVRLSFCLVCVCLIVWSGLFVCPSVCFACLSVCLVLSGVVCLSVYWSVLLVCLSVRLQHRQQGGGGVAFKFFLGVGGL